MSLCGDQASMADLVTPQAASSRRPAVKNIERGKDSRAVKREEASRADQLSVKGRIEIPHNPVRLEGGVLSTDRIETDFVREMTHDLRTPLHVIIGLCQLLERDRKTPLSTLQRDAVDRMERNARALLQIINHLLACLRAGRFECVKLF